MKFVYRELIKIDYIKVISFTEKPPGYYVTRAGGLFPAPLPQDAAICDRVCKYFWLLGVFLAKVRKIIRNKILDIFNLKFHINKFQFNPPE